MNELPPRTVRSRQIAKILIAPWVLKNRLHLPEGTKIIVASSDWQSRDAEEPALSMVVYHPDIPPTPDDGRSIPIANPSWVSDRIEDDQVVGGFYTMTRFNGWGL